MHTMQIPRLQNKFDIWFYYMYHYVWSTSLAMKTFRFLSFSNSMRQLRYGRFHVFSLKAKEWKKYNHIRVDGMFLYLFQVRIFSTKRPVM